MADAEDVSDDGPKKKGKAGLLIGLVLSVLAGGGAFAFTSGMIGGDGGEKDKATKASVVMELETAPTNSPGKQAATPRKVLRDFHSGEEIKLTPPRSEVQRPATDAVELFHIAVSAKNPTFPQSTRLGSVF